MLVFTLGEVGFFQAKPGMFSAAIFVKIPKKIKVAH